MGHEKSGPLFCGENSLIRLLPAISPINTYIIRLTRRWIETFIIEITLIEQYY